MKVQEILKRTQDFFDKKSIPNARLEAEILLAQGLGWNRIQLYTQFDYPMDESQLATCRTLVQRRMSGEPLAYVVGHQDFYKNSFAVAPGVLIPRPETEELVGHCLEFLKTNFVSESEIKIADLGAGTGCIGLTLALEDERALVDLFETSDAAIPLLSKNLEKMELSERCRIHQLDLDKESSSSFLEKGLWQYHLIVSNPPYIAKEDVDVEESVRRFEPEAALFASDEGLAKIKHWGPLAIDVALPGALIAMEIGWKQGESVKSFFSDIEDVESVEVKKDLSGHDRFLMIKKVGTPTLA